MLPSEQLQKLYIKNIKLKKVNKRYLNSLFVKNLLRTGFQIKVIEVMEKILTRGEGMNIYLAQK